jgi:hypothetical protein
LHHRTLDLGETLCPLCVTATGPVFTLPPLLPIFLAPARRAAQAELPMFADLAGLKAAAESSRATLVALVTSQRAARDAAKAATAAAQAELSDRRGALSRDPQATALEAAEAKLRLAEQNAFTLREFVAARGRETDYAAPKAEATRLVGELNLLAQRAQRALGAAATAGPFQHAIYGPMGGRF